jgi:thiol-disulfide isomerase/thioredoxin
MIARSVLSLMVTTILLFPVVGLADALPKGIITLDGRQAPALKLNDFDGQPYDLATARGRWVFVHFWASWCGPCRREMPAIQRLRSMLDDTKLELVLINTAEDEDTIFSFLAAVAPDLQTLLDTDGLATEDWQPRGLPATYLVDPQGRLRYQALGGRPWDTDVYVQFLRRLTAATPPPPPNTVTR